MTNPLNMGHLIEGTIEQDPLTDKFFIRTVDQQGKASRFDIEAALAEHKGKEVRFTLISFENLAQLAELVEASGAGAVVTGLEPDNLPGFDVQRKP
jgi:hypothetical protein